MNASSPSRTPFFTSVPEIMLLGRDCTAKAIASSAERRSPATQRAGESWINTGVEPHEQPRAASRAVLGPRESRILHASEEDALLGHGDAAAEMQRASGLARANRGDWETAGALVTRRNNCESNFGIFKYTDTSPSHFHTQMHSCI